MAKSFSKMNSPPLTAVCSALILVDFKHLVLLKKYIKKSLAINSTHDSLK